MIAAELLSKEQLLERARLIEMLAAGECTSGYGRKECKKDGTYMCISCRMNAFLEEEAEKAKTKIQNKEMDDLV